MERPICSDTHVICIVWCPTLSPGGRVWLGGGEGGVLALLDEDRFIKE